jgi:CheY-like chemotaxis protein
MRARETTATPPAARPAGSRDDRRSAEPELARLGALDGVSVLVVEDDPLSRETFERVLSHYGAHVTSVASVRAGLSSYAHERPSVIVSDIGLPDHDGFTLVRAVRAQERGGGCRTPAIAVSGSSSRETSERACGAGFDAFLPKPVDVAALLRVVRALASTT